MNDKKEKIYSLGEELANSISHGVAAVLAIAGLVILIWAAVIKADIWAVVSVCIYGGTQILLYTMSTLYHAFTGPRVKGVFRIFDHCSIFLLIAGTYTPFTLISLRGTTGYIIFAAIWALAILGIVLNAVNIKKFKVFSMICYVGMGWMIIFAIKPLVEAIARGGLALLVSGGLSYTLGIIFYLLSGRVKYSHSIWHLFVLAGSVLHYFAILFYVL